jgi:uncharacterized membrane protein
LYIPYFSKKEAFNETEKAQIVSAIGQAERLTSGEIRVYVESRCRYVNSMHRAAEIFAALNMEKTAARNGVLVYVAIKDRQVAIFGDEGINAKVGSSFWHEQVRKILSHFTNADYAGGIARVVTEIGAALQKHFPYDEGTDKNELPDDIVFGR